MATAAFVRLRRGRQARANLPIGCTVTQLQDTIARIRSSFAYPKRFFWLALEDRSDMRGRMRRQVFVTGAGGFIGKNLVERLTVAAGQHIKILTRTKSAQPSANKQIEEVVGDLLKPETYQAALEGCDTVVHLAAATGRVAPSECQRVNVEGTKKLLQACKAAGVRRFLHVSTIAAGYPNQRYYPYAQTKDKGRSCRERKRA